jgi:hypothetical protein
VKKAIAKKAPYAVKRDAGGIATLVVEVRALIAAARHAAASTINTLQVLTNFEIGRRIVEHEQKGEKRAEYGAELIKVLSDRLYVLEFLGLEEKPGYNESDLETAGGEPDRRPVNGQP